MMLVKFSMPNKMEFHDSKVNWLSTSHHALAKKISKFGITVQATTSTASCQKYAPLKKYQKRVMNSMAKLFMYGTGKIRHIGIERTVPSAPNRKYKVNFVSVLINR